MKVRASFCRGSLCFSRSGCWENPTAPSVPSWLIPVLPRIPGCGNTGGNGARGRQNTLGCPGEAAAPGAPYGQVSQPPSFPKTAALFCSDTARRPHPHPARHGKLMGEQPGCAEGAFPALAAALSLPWPPPSACPQQPQHGAAAGHSPVSFSYQNSKEQGSALSPLICSAASAKLPAVPHPAVDEGSRSL